MYPRRHSTNFFIYLFIIIITIICFFCLFFLHVRKFASHPTEENNEFWFWYCTFLNCDCNVYSLKEANPVIWKSVM